MSVAEALEFASKYYGTDNFVTKKNLLNPTSEFVFKFYCDLLNDYNEKVSSIIGCELKLNLNANPDFPPEFNLFCEVAKFYKPLYIQSFSILDILRPAPKRTTLFVMHGIHYLTYVNNVLNSRKNAVSGLVIQYEKLANLQEETQRAKDEMDQFTGAIALCDKDHKKLNDSADVIDRRYEKMLEEKNDRDKFLAEKHSELNLLKIQKENSEFEIKLLENKERELGNGIVNDNKFESLKSSENCLKKEAEKLKTDCDNLAEHVKTSKTDLQFFENCLSLLESLEFSSAKLNKLIDHRMELDSLNHEGNMINKNLDSLKSEVETKENNVKSLKDKMKLLNQEHDDLKKELQTIMEESKDKIAMKSNNMQKKIDYRHRLEEIIKSLEASKEEVLNDEKLLKQHVVNKYQQILNSLRSTVATFNNMLIRERNLARNSY